VLEIKSTDVFEMAFHTKQQEAFEVDSISAQPSLLAYIFTLGVN